MRPHNKKHNTCGDSKMNLLLLLKGYTCFGKTKDICEILAKPLYTRKYT